METGSLGAKFYSLLPDNLGMALITLGGRRKLALSQRAARKYTVVFCASCRADGIE